MIVVNIPLFYTINEIPIVLDLVRLDDSGGIGETLRKYEEQYYQSCLRMFNSNDNFQSSIKAPQALHNTPPLLGAPKVIL